MAIKITKGLNLSLEGEINNQVLPELTNLTSMSYDGLIDDDVKFIGSTLNIKEENLIS